MMVSVRRPLKSVTVPGIYWGYLATLGTVLVLLRWGPPLMDNVVGFATRRNSFLLDEQQSPEVVTTSDAENGKKIYRYDHSMRKYRDMPTWTDRYPFLPRIDDVPDDKRVCFVHVGKTAGSTLSCFLGFQYPACDYRMKVIPGYLPQYTTNVIHTRYDTCERENIAVYLFTLRDPLKRLMSWFTYERPNRNTSERQVKIKRPLYIDCGFQTMNQVGEAMSEGNSTVCSRRAWRAVQGLQGFMSHNKYNFGYYWSRIRHHRTARIAVIRTEHLQDDWASVEMISLNGPKNITYDFGKKNQSHKNKEDTYLSKEAHRNLCDGLCEEIQIYKLVLQRAENLTPNDVEVSMQELKESCPVEAVAERCPRRPDFHTPREPQGQ